MKNKILTITVIFILLSFIFINTNVFATETTNTLIVDGHDMSDIYNYFSPDDAFFIYIAPGTTSYFFYKPTGNGYTSHVSLFSTKETATVLYCNSSWNYYGHVNFYSFDTSTERFKLAWEGDCNGDHNISNMNIVYASKGIYNADHETFFMNPPAPPVPTTLAGVLEATNPTQTFQTMIHGIIPYLIALVVGLVAFWKAWQLLLKELRKA